jgi:hypothetical protein
MVKSCALLAPANPATRRGMCSRLKNSASGALLLDEPDDLGID